ncbi:MAG: helix-turn-helix domain-containing protein, partial [Desulfobulbaceae bacterium]|nr:helix-turn-helix domain-containing protein [Desulfobulbaceae bacterium]
MTIMTKDSTHADKAVVRGKSLAADGETLGCYLKKHRLQQNQKLEDIAGKLRLQTATLQAIEENNHAALPAEVFTRGFIKSYALQLGLDPEEALRWHIRQTAAGGGCREEKINVQEVLASEALAHRHNFPWKRILAFFFLLFCLAALGYLALTTMDLSSLGWNDFGQKPAAETPTREL